MPIMNVNLTYDEYINCPSLKDVNGNKYDEVEIPGGYIEIDNNTSLYLHKYETPKKYYLLYLFGDVPHSSFIRVFDKADIRKTIKRIDKDAEVPHIMNNLHLFENVARYISQQPHTNKYTVKNNKLSISLRYMEEGLDEWESDNLIDKCYQHHFQNNN